MSTWVVVIYCQTLCVGLTFHMPAECSWLSMHRGGTDMQPLIVTHLCFKLGPEWQLATSRQLSSAAAAAAARRNFRLEVQRHRHTKSSLIEMHAFQSVSWWAVQVLWAVRLSSKLAQVQWNHHLLSLLRVWLGRALGLWRLSGASGQS